jgi:drug/metabolite transporter (DMT)-like permease
MDGSLFGIITGLSATILFALNGVATRRGVLEGHIYSNAFASIIIGIPLYLIYLLMVGEYGLIFSMDINILILFILAGILHFLIGRVLLYSSVHYIGAASAFPIISISNILAAFVAIPVLNETINFMKIVGLLIATVGVYLISSIFFDIRSYRFGLVLGLSAAVTFAITSIIIRYALLMYDYPIVGVFISYIYVAPFYFALISWRRIREEFRSININILKYIVMASIFVDVAQLLRYVTLEYIEVSIIGPIFALMPFFTIGFSYLFNRDIEIFDVKIIVATFLIIIGIIFVIMGMETL